MDLNLGPSGGKFVSSFFLGRGLRVQVWYEDVFGYCVVRRVYLVVAV